MDNSGQILQMSEIRMNYGLLSDDEEEEDDVELDCYTTSQDLLMRQDMISNSLVESGTIHGMAAAAALATARRRNKNFKFEIDPAVRRRQQTRLMRKLKQILNELCSRCGLQAVVLSLSGKGKENPTFKVTGSHPLDQAVRACQTTILREFEKDLQAKVDSKINDNMNKEDVFELPNLVVDGIPTSIDRMNQAQLRMFIPEMLKYATGRGKPGWGKDSFKPIWWPKDVPWANVRRDVRPEHIKNKIPWSQALRQIVRNCYRFHNRDELLQGIVTSPCERDDEEDMTQLTQCHRLKLPDTNDHHQQHELQNGLQSPTFVHTVHNADGSVALVQVDNGQTIATIAPDSAGNAMATLSANHHHHHSVVPSDGSGGNGQVGSSRAELHHNLHHHDDDDDDMDEGTWTITTEDPHHHHHHHHSHHHQDYDVINTNDQLISGEGLELRTSDVNRVSTTDSPPNNHHHDHLDVVDDVDVDDVTTYDHPHHMDFFHHHTTHHHHHANKLQSSSSRMLTSSSNNHDDDPDVILATDDLMTSSQQQQQRIDYHVTIEHDGDLIDDEDDDVTIN